MKLAMSNFDWGRCCNGTMEVLKGTALERYGYVSYRCETCLGGLTVSKEEAEKFGLALIPVSPAAKEIRTYWRQGVDCARPEPDPEWERDWNKRTMADYHHELTDACDAEDIDRIAVLVALGDHAPISRASQYRGLAYGWLGKWKKERSFRDRQAAPMAGPRTGPGFCGARGCRVCSPRPPRAAIKDACFKA